MVIQIIKYNRPLGYFSLNLSPNKPPVTIPNRPPTAVNNPKTVPTSSISTP